MNQLTSASADGTTDDGSYSEVYTYDPTTGNLLTKGTPTVVSGVTIGQNLYQYDPNHAHAVQYLKQAANQNSTVGTYTYDANGNQTERVVGGQANALVYDAENRLTQVCQDFKW